MRAKQTEHLLHLYGFSRVSKSRQLRGHSRKRYLTQYKGEMRTSSKMSFKMFRPRKLALAILADVLPRCSVSVPGGFLPFWRRRPTHCGNSRGGQERCHDGHSSKTKMNLKESHRIVPKAKDISLDERARRTRACDELPANNSLLWGPSPTLIGHDERAFPAVTLICSPRVAKPMRRQPLAASRKEVRRLTVRG